MMKYTLTKPLKYGNKELRILQANEPCVRHMMLIAKIKEGYNDAQLDMLNRLKKSGIEISDTQKSSEPQEKPSEDEMYESVRNILNSACSGTTQIYDNIKALLMSSGICQIGCEDDNMLKIEIGHIDKLSVEDFIAISARYIAVFISPASS